MSIFEAIPENGNFNGYVNLAQPRLGAEVLSATDDFFAEKEMLLKPEDPIFIDGKYTDRGTWMDGWESRRRREPGHDACIIRICRGTIYAVDIDTANFTGNYPEKASIEACDSNSDPDESTSWFEIVPPSPLNGDIHNIFNVESVNIWSHLRLSIYPDGGVARLRVYGTVHKNWSIIEPDESVDLAAMVNGGVALVCSDMHYGSMSNLLNPGRPLNMGDGWETRRRRGPGHDWVIVRLGHPGQANQIWIDTLHFKGNFPGRCAVRGVFAPAATAEQLAASSMNWTTLLPETPMQADHNHVFTDEVVDSGVVSHVKLEMYPDGGIGRLCVFGTISGLNVHQLVPQPLTADGFQPFGDVVEIEDRPSRKINHGFSDRFENIVNLDITEEGEPSMSIFRSRPVSFPFPIVCMERHPYASQAIIPKGNARFLVLVAEPSDQFIVENLRLFVTNGRQGVNYRRGVWHHFVLAIEQEQEFIVIDRSKPEENTEEIELDTPYPIIENLPPD